MPRLPVRLMTMHQAKGREMDAIILVHLPEDLVRDTPIDRAKLSRVHFVVVARARRMASIILPSDGHPLYAWFRAMA